ncbi:MAG TPA: Do family serine endopeptidase [Terriglobales bacterium]|jgi:serine protease Do|nr:Do family serine endopeptidase [Terriglobales bacterium]
MKSWKQVLSRRFMATTVAVGMVLGLAAYESTNSAKAATAAPSSSVQPLDDNSVGALLSLDKAMETLAARVTPAIVNVSVTSKNTGQRGDMRGDDDSDDSDGGMQQFFGPFGGNPFGGGRNMRPQPRVEHGIGSGVIISPDGYIVTNNHVIDGAMDIRVTFSDRRIMSAKLIGADPLTDLAVIKVEGSGYPSAPLGDSTKLHPGQTVLAFGNPMGFRFTVTRGIVSALNRPNPGADRRSPGQFIQTDAAINPGNSGGPLVNSRGEVVGINTFLISSTGGFSGMGFAIPTQIVRPTTEALMRDGKVNHGYMGIGIADVTPDQAKFFHVDKAVGAVVSEVQPDSPGAKAGLKVGDVITELNGKAINDAGELQVEVGQKQPGNTIHLGVMRDGKSENIPVTLESMNRDKDNQSADAGQGKPRWGVGLGDLTPEVRQQVQVDNSVRGAVIERVMPGSPADNAGLQQGDIIMEVNRKPMQSAAEVQKALAAVPSNEDALVLVWSGGGSTFRVLHPTQS